MVRYSSARREGIWENGGTAPFILVLGTKWKKWPTLHLGRFTPETRAHITHRTVMTRFDCCHVVYLQKQAVVY